MEDNSELLKERRYWIQWLGYMFRKDSDNFFNLVASEYKEWAEGVLGRKQYGFGTLEPTKTYFDAAFRKANLQQLREFYAVRYIVQHPVNDGVPYSGNCMRVALPAIQLSKV